MSFTSREWWGLIHGMGLGALFLLAFAGGAFAYTRGRDSRWESLVYATVCLFLAGIAIRARQTGGL